MKVLFAGPSLAGMLDDLDDQVVVRGPARQGDIARAVLEGADAIGLVDGVYENVAAVWHKEILFALAEGVRVAGAASMGALRAAECAAYGMVGIGRVFHAYASGALADDAAVAQLHAPEELGHTAMTEALVNVEATFARLRERRLIADDEHERLTAAARRLFFKERTYERILAAAEDIDPSRRARLGVLVASERQDVKRADALDLVDYLSALPAGRADAPQDWRFVASPMWRSFLSRATAELSPSPTP